MPVVAEPNSGYNMPRRFERLKEIPLMVLAFALNEIGVRVAETKACAISERDVKIELG
ncbi:MAG: hypothetical protein ACREQW_21090 [Candidatus Binatia bacterium]